MDEIDNKEIFELLEGLPLQIQEVIKNSNWTEKVSIIGKRHNLTLDQMAQLENLVILTMLGVVNPQKISAELTEIGIKTDQINIIVSELDQEIFQKIKSSLVDNFEKNERVENTEKKDEPARADILKEIEDKDETVGHSTYASSALIIEPSSPLPSTQVNTAEQNQEIISKNSIAQKLQTPSVSAPKTVTVDPYREMPL